MVHVFNTPQGVAFVAITDVEYPAQVAHNLLSKIGGEFRSKYPRTAYADFTEGSPALSFPELTSYLAKYQNPEEADSIMKINKELDETKIVMMQTIDSMLERGEKIDNLVAKSDGLSAQSKMFYTQVCLCRSRLVLLCVLTA
jgi:synaptobrevin family protein YKT6